MGCSMSSVTAHEPPAVRLCMCPRCLRSSAGTDLPPVLHHCCRRWLQERSTWRSKLVALLQHVGPAGQKALQAPARRLLSSDVLVANFADLPEEVRVVVYQVGGLRGWSACGFHAIWQCCRGTADMWHLLGAALAAT